MKYKMLEHASMAEMKEKHPDWIWNRSDTHVILGVPGTLDAFKTPVEPGNSFSPGPGTYGISSWIYEDGVLYAPENMPLTDLEWKFEAGHLPVLTSCFKCGKVRVTSRLFTEGDTQISDIRDYYRIELTNSSEEAAQGSLFIPIRSFGAAGGAIHSLKSSAHCVRINGAPVFIMGKEPEQFRTVSYAKTGKDISCYLKKGQLPGQWETEDASGWASGVLVYSYCLKPGESGIYDFMCRLHAGHWMVGKNLSYTEEIHWEETKERLLTFWKKKLKIGLQLPDKRFADAFYCQLVHLYMFTVHDDPRISPVSYPLWWLRDGAYVVNALNKGGMHEFSEASCRGIAQKYAFGGFGSEGDAPGEIIWILSEHYLLTRDQEYLEDMYPHIRKKAEFLLRMLETDKPVKIHTEFTTPQMMLEPNLDMMCLPAAEGLIQGRMDNHYPIIWVNSFAYLGLSRAALCAEAAGYGEEAKKWKAAAEKLKAAIKRKSSQIFGQNDRDVNCAFWPAGWASVADKEILDKFDEFWENVRCPGGVHHPEPLWTYFEAGQAHNQLLTGRKDRAWVSIEMFLSTHTAPGLYTYHEGENDENSAQLWQRTRGWDDINYVTPHGWTAAEVFLLLRDCLIREDDGTLLIGSGIPESWLKEDFEVRNIPTYYGPVSFHYSARQNCLEVETQADKVVSCLPEDIQLIRTQKPS